MGPEKHISAYEPTVETLGLSSEPLGETLTLTTAPKFTITMKCRLSAIKTFPIKETRELSYNPSSQRRCPHIEFDLTEFHELKYKTSGYHVVWPMNSNEEVDCLVKIFGLAKRKDDVLSIRPLEPESANPSFNNCSSPIPISPSHFRSCIARNTPIIDAIRPTQKCKTFWRRLDMIRLRILRSCDHTI